MGALKSKLSYSPIKDYKLFVKYNAVGTTKHLQLVIIINNAKVKLVI